MKSFASVTELVSAEKRGDNWLARCPAHDDRSPSLSLAEGNDGRTLFTCHAGCSTESILAALDLTWADFLPTRGEPENRQWNIRDLSGKLIAEHVRVDEPGGKRFVWRRDGRAGLGGLKVRALPLYRSELELVQGKAVFLTEGEKAADAAARLGLQALGTVCGANSTPGADALALLADHDVILWPDHDEPGVTHMQRIADALDGVAKSLRWLHVCGARPKDDAADYRGTVEELRGKVKAEPPTIAGPLVMFADRVDSAARELDRLDAGDFADFVSTGIESLDRRLGGGLRRGHVTLIGAPTGAGKTTLVVQLAMAAQRQGLALIASPEMSTEELVTREIVRRSGKAKWQRAPWVASRLREEARESHERVAAELRTEPPRVALLDAIDVSLEDVVRAARAAHRQRPISLVALDYAQQLAGADPKKSRHLLVGDVGHRAVELARELHCPVVVTSQVNTFKDGREKDYSFRESQILEHKAHIVLLFLAERNSRGEVERATFRARKARDAALFELEVDFDPATFSVRDRGESAPKLQDWTRSDADIEPDAEESRQGWLQV